MESCKDIRIGILVIGGGAAACQAAISAKNQGADVLIIDKGQLGKSGCSPNAHGGMAIYHKHEKDNWKVHMADTLMSGGFLNDQEVVKTMCEGGLKFNRILEHYGSIFNRDDDGTVSVRSFGGHQYNRTVFCGDETGHEMMAGLKREIFRQNIPFIDELMIVKLLVDDAGVVGAIGWDLKKGGFFKIMADAVILATADSSGVWPSASERQRGDGTYLAFDAGAELTDCEFIQYHPTHAWWPYGVRGSVSESFRSEGGYLLNSEGERFMLRYDPDQKELATRDKVSVCVYKEILAGKGAEHGGIYATVAHLAPGHVERRLPIIFKKYMDFGYDVRKGPIEVRPRPHYVNGGVVVSINSETKVPGLYAAGAVTAGVHGANRVGSNSLVDIMVFGDIAGTHAAMTLKEKKFSEKAVDQVVKSEIRRIEDLFSDSKKKPITVAPIKRQHWELMDECMGVIRTEKKMLKLLKEVERTKDEELPHLVVHNKSRVYNYEVRDALEIPFRLLVEEVGVRAALARKESRGSHYRDDFPTRNDKEWLKNIIFFKENGEIKMETREVKQSVMRMEELPKYAASDSPWH